MPPKKADIRRGRGRGIGGKGSHEASRENVAGPGTSEPIEKEKNKSTDKKEKSLKSPEPVKETRNTSESSSRAPQGLTPAWQKSFVASSEKRTPSYEPASGESREIGPTPQGIDPSVKSGSGKASEKQADNSKSVTTLGEPESSPASPETEVELPHAQILGGEVIKSPIEVRALNLRKGRKERPLPPALTTANPLQVRLARDTIPALPGQDIGDGDGTPVPTPTVSSSIDKLIGDINADIEGLASITQEMQAGHRLPKTRGDAGEEHDTRSSQSSKEIYDFYDDYYTPERYRQATIALTARAHTISGDTLPTPASNPAISQDIPGIVGGVRWIDESIPSQRPMFEPAVALPPAWPTGHQAQIFGTLGEGESVNEVARDEEDAEALNEYIRSGAENDEARKKRNARMLQNRKILAWDTYARNHPDTECVKLADDAMRQYRIDGTQTIARLVSKENDFRNMTSERDEWKSIAQGVYGEGCVTEVVYKELVRKYDKTIAELKTAHREDLHYMEVELDSVKETSRYNETKCYQMQNIIDEFEEKAKAAEIRVKWIVSKLDDANFELSNSKTLVEDLERNIKGYKQDIDQLKRDNEAFRRALDPDNQELDIKKKWELAKLTIQALEERIMKLQKQLEDRDLELKQRDRDIKEKDKIFKSDKKKLQTSLDACLEGRIRDQEQTRGEDDKDKEIKRLKIECIRLRGENKKNQQQKAPEEPQSKGGKATEDTTTVFAVSDIQDDREALFSRIQSQGVEIERLKTELLDTRGKVWTYESQSGGGAPNVQTLKDIITSQQDSLDARAREIAELKAKSLGQREEWATLKEMVEYAVGVSEEEGPKPGPQISHRPPPTPVSAPRLIFLPSTPKTPMTARSSRFVREIDDEHEKPSPASLKFLYLTLRVSLQQTMKNRAVHGFQIGDLDEANTIAEQFNQDASASRIDEQIALSFYYMGLVAFYRDDLAAARDAFEKAEDRDSLPAAAQKDIFRWIKRCNEVGVGRSPATYGGAVVRRSGLDSLESTPPTKIRRKKGGIKKGNLSGSFMRRQGNLQQRTMDRGSFSGEGWNIFGTRSPARSPSIERVTYPRPPETVIPTSIKRSPETPRNETEIPKDENNLKSIVNSVISWASPLAVVVTSPPPSKHVTPEIQSEPVSPVKVSQISTGSPVRKRKPRAATPNPAEPEERIPAVHSQSQSPSSPEAPIVHGDIAPQSVLKAVLQRFPFAWIGGAISHPASDSSETSSEVDAAGEEPSDSTFVQQQVRLTGDTEESSGIVPRDLVEIDDSPNLLLKGGSMPIAQPRIPVQRYTYVAYRPPEAAPVTGAVTPFPRALTDSSLLPDDNVRSDVELSEPQDSDQDGHGLDALLETLTHDGDVEVTDAVQNFEPVQVAGRSFSLGSEVERIDFD